MDKDANTKLLKPEEEKRSGIKYYKQKYRKEWEKLPDFADWLKGIPGEPKLAFCIYCKKKLGAHRLALLKHTCTMKHTKAAQAYFRTQFVSDRQKLKMNENKKDLLSDDYEPKLYIVNDDGSEKDEDERTKLTKDLSNNSIVHSTKEVKKADVKEISSNMSGSPLTTHVLDTSRGCPASGLPVSLYRLIDGRWTLLSERVTNPDGRIQSQLVHEADFVAGRYKLHFDVYKYFELRKQESFYPFVEIVFDVTTPKEHYHVPLLLSPFGYTTYRGS